MKKIVQFSKMLLVVLLIAFDEVRACECIHDNGCKIVKPAAKGYACKCVPRKIIREIWYPPCCAPNRNCEDGYTWCSDRPSYEDTGKWACDGEEIPCSQSRNVNECTTISNVETDGTTAFDCLLGMGCCNAYIAKGWRMCCPCGYNKGKLSAVWTHRV